MAIQKTISPPLTPQNYLKIFGGGDRGDVLKIFILYKFYIFLDNNYFLSGYC